jgi:YHS domain-containing protein
MKNFLHPLIAFLFFALSSSCSDTIEESVLDDLYVLDFCIVSGGDLDEMGGPVSYEHNGTLIQFCCKPCIPKFQKNPAKYLVILREELEAGKADANKTG